MKPRSAEQVEVALAEAAQMAGLAHKTVEKIWDHRNDLVRSALKTSDARKRNKPCEVLRVGFWRSQT